ncbi:hypothetical protein [Parvimonas sp. D9]|uniref:hypothetical protein n=1 Tax=Parvimonas sp. D9 TaxID=3110689 RepID=UPI002B469CAF|nr:hypothetical protein [Parvimonas sp. D9]
MMVAYELGKDEYEIAQWKYDDLVRWLAFFRIKSAAEERAFERAKNQNKGNMPVFGGSSSGTQVIID